MKIPTNIKYIIIIKIFSKIVTIYVFFNFSLIISSNNCMLIKNIIKCVKI
jgi:hypothetical protein